MTGWSLERRLVCVEVVLLALAVLCWLLFTDGGRGSLSTCLFWSGMGAIGLGVALLSGAWRRYREPDIYYVLGVTSERIVEEFQSVRRAYSDLNVLALAGCVTLIVSLLVL